MNVKLQKKYLLFQTADINRNFDTFTKSILNLNENKFYKIRMY